MSMKTLAARIQYQGGNSLGRINQQKLNGLRAALKEDYNSRMITTPKKGNWACLINNNQSGLKADYDKKLLSVEFNAQLQPGDVFQVLDDHTYWMVYLPILTETAYLRTEIIRCRYTLDINGQKYRVYFQGPTETTIQWNEKGTKEVNSLNYSGTIYIKNDENTASFFKRFTIIKIEGHNWQVQVVDTISVPGIIELEVQEYFDNTPADLPEIKQEEISLEDVIIGKEEVFPDSIIGYEVNEPYYNSTYSWSITNNDRVRIIETFDDNRIVKIQVLPGTPYSFDVNYGPYSRTINVKWQEPYIKGPSEMRVYDTATFYIENGNPALPGTFFVSPEDKEKVLVKQLDDFKCEVQEYRGKKGEFVLFYKVNNGSSIYRLPIAIKSF